MIVFGMVIAYDEAPESALELLVTSFGTEVRGHSWEIPVSSGQSMHA